MSLASSLRSFVPLAIGLVVGGVGVTMFMESAPGAPGSPEERASKLEVELTRAKNRLTELEALSTDGTNRFTDPRRTLTDGTRSILQKIRSGQRVSPEEIFHTVKPTLSDLSPLFDRLRVREARRRIDSLTGEFARKYDLTAEQQKSLKVWFDAKTREESKRMGRLLARPETQLEDMMRASREVRPDEGLDQFMEGVLSGDKLGEFKAQRMNERAERVQNEADMKVQRLDSIVGLTDAQRDQAFSVLARSSRDYDPAMVLEGPGAQFGTAPVKNGREAMLAILTPDQRAAYDGRRRARFQEMESDMNAVGLTMPPNWEFLDDDDFR
jgi:hypothetical protein